VSLKWDLKAEFGAPVWRLLGTNAYPEVKATNVHRLLPMGAELTIRETDRNPFSTKSKMKR
jgi:hypothetical protein